MKKSLILCAAMLACALSFQSCSKEDNVGASTMDEMAYDLARVDFATIIDKYTNANNELYLPAGAEVTIDKAIELEAPLYIIGDKKNPAKIVAKAGFVTNSSLIFENVEINAAEVKTPFIQLATVTLDEGQKAKSLDLIAFINSKISNLKYQFIYANKQKYLIDCINVQKSIIAVDGKNKKTIFDFNGGGLPSFLGIDESTIYAEPKLEQAGGFFSSQSGSKMSELGAESQIFSISNSTLYNISYGKNTSSLRENSQATQKFAVKNCIIVNCGKEGQFLAGLNAGQKGKAENWEVSGNMINFGGKDVSATELSKINAESISPIEGVITFADAEKGDFTQKQTSAGDPRWIANAQ